MAFLFDWETMEIDEYTHDTSHGTVVQLGERNYIRLDGVGDESSTEFMTKAGAIIALGQYMTESAQHGIEIDGARNYIHYPLDVTWNGIPGTTHETFTIRMKHPNFMPKDAVDQAIDQLKADNPLIGEIVYERFEEGLEAELGHVGVITPTDSVVAKLSSFVDDGPFETDAKATTHQELYLNDITSIPAAQWQVILRQHLQIKDQAKADRYPIVMN